ncbi:MAG: hypothetical protein ACI88S_000983, partial [Ilumatobacter sp.]
DPDLQHQADDEAGCDAPPSDWPDTHGGGSADRNGDDSSGQGARAGPDDPTIHEVSIMSGDMMETS